MNALFLLIATVGISLQYIVKKSYSQRVVGGLYIFSGISVCAAALFFLCIGGFRIDFSPSVLPYSLGFGICYAVATVATYLAIRLGPLSLISLINSFSLALPTLYGLIFFNERAGVFFYIGLLFLIISIFLVNSKRGKVSITLGWVVAVTISFLGNGICTVIQNVQQRLFDGAYKNELMVFALVGVAAALIIVALFSERAVLKKALAAGTHLMIICGVANGAVNLFVMMLATRMPASLMFPIISAGGIILSWGVSRFLYKETLSLKQNAALIFGILSVIFMNL